MNQNYNFVRNLLTQETNARKEESKSFSSKKQTLFSTQGKQQAFSIRLDWHRTNVLITLGNAQNMFFMTLSNVNIIFYHIK